MRHRIVRVMAGFLALGLIAASCGDDDSTPATAPIEEAPADDAAMADEEPADEAPADDAAMADEEPADEAPADDAAMADEEPADEAPADDAAMADEEPADEAPADDAAMADEEPAEEAAVEPAGVDLASVCPNPLVIQTGWFPQAERAWFWGLIADGEVDSERGTLRGPAKADPNLTIEVRAGGPLNGFQAGNSLLHADPEIFMADQNLDAMIAASEAFPTVGVIAPMSKHPAILMWDPDDLDITSMDDIRESGATVLVSGNAVYAEALAGLGILDPGQVDFSWDFSPARFVAEDGIVQQGFVTDAPYTYEHSIQQFGKAVDYILVSEAGFPTYGPIGSVHPDTITEEADCLAEFIPVIQREIIDWSNDPVATNALVSGLTEAFSSPVPVSVEHQLAARDRMIQDGLLSNGPNGVLGEFDLDQVQELIDITVPIFVGQGSDVVDPDVAVEDLVTNEFLDPDIGL